MKHNAPAILAILHFAFSIFNSNAAEYTVRGERWLRMYTADRATPVYNARLDAARIVNGFCNVPWTKSNVASAHETSHSSTNLDANVANREAFDAALFCANHAESMHVAYANASCYRIDLGSGTLPNLTSLDVNVYSDPYNASGARIVLMTNDTGVIPTDCATVRGDVAGGIRATNVARRVTVTSGGKDYWYPNSTNLVFSAQQLGASGIQLHRYLYVFVLLENYGTTRGDWLEGSAFIDNEIRIVTSAAIEGIPAPERTDMRIALICNEEHFRQFGGNVVIEQYPNEEPCASITARGSVNVQTPSATSTPKSVALASSPIGRHTATAEPGTEYEFMATLKDVRNEASRFTAFVDENGNGSFDPGEPFGFARGVNPSSGGFAEIEMRSVHPVFGRVKLSANAENDRDTVFGPYSGNIAPKGISDFFAARMMHVTVDRTAVNGVSIGRNANEILLSMNELVLNKWFDLRTRNFITESDILQSGLFDIDCVYFDDFTDDPSVLGMFGGEVGYVSYRLVISDDDYIHPIPDYGTNRVLNVAFTRRFDHTNARSIPQSLTNLTAHGEQRLAWSLGSNDTYTGARLQIASVSGSSTNVVHDGTAFLANVRRRIGSGLYYTAEIPPSVPSGNYVWRVTALNSKFQTDAFSSYAPITIR